MENNKTQYWKGLEELHGEEAFEKQRYNEFAEKLPLGHVINEAEMGLSANRRDFLPPAPGNDDIPAFYRVIKLV